MKHTVDLIDNGRIVKDYPNVRANESLPILRRRIQTKLVRIFDYLGILNWMNGNDVRMSGVIHLINSNSKKMDVTGKQYLYEDGLKEIKKQYDLNIAPSTFMNKYGEYLV